MQRALIAILALSLAPALSLGCGDDGGSSAAVPFAALEAQAAAHTRLYDDFCVYDSHASWLGAPTTIVHTFDDGRLVRSTLPSPPPTRQVDFRYDDAGRLVEEYASPTSAKPDGVTIVHTYPEPDLELIQSYDGTVPPTTPIARGVIRRYALGHLVREESYADLDGPMDAYVVHEYDAAGRETASTAYDVEDGGDVRREHHTWTYDDAGRPLRHQWGLLDAGPELELVYTWEAHGALSVGTGAAGRVATGDPDYTYELVLDQHGNTLWQREVLADDRTQSTVDTWTYDCLE